MDYLNVISFLIGVIGLVIGCVNLYYIRDIRRDLGGNETKGRLLFEEKNYLGALEYFKKESESGSAYGSYMAGHILEEYLKDSEEYNEEKKVRKEQPEIYYYKKAVEQESNSHGMRLKKDKQSGFLAKYKIAKTENELEVWWSEFEKCKKEFDNDTNSIAYMWRGDVENKNKKNSKKAVEYYRKSANLGNATGLRKLAIATNDMKEKKMYYIMAVMKGDVDSMANLMEIM